MQCYYLYSQEALLIQLIIHSDNKTERKLCLGFMPTEIRGFHTACQDILIILSTNL